MALKFKAAGALAFAAMLIGCQSTVPPQSTTLAFSGEKTLIELDPNLPSTWARKPTPENYIDNYPPLAQRYMKNGLAAVRCATTKVGKLVDCAVLKELPDGFDFGAASIAALSHARINPPMQNGSAVRAEITILVRWAVQN